MQADTKSERRAFDAIIIVPLEEEFEVVLEQFTFVENLTNDEHIRFAVSVSGHPETYLVVKQALMGRTASANAAHSCLSDFDTGILISVGIAGGLSNDVYIGDVCYTGAIIDVLDNQKVSEALGGQQQIMLSPTFYQTPRALATPIALYRVNPDTKPAHLEWTAERQRIASTLIPNEFTGRAGKKDTIRGPVVHEGAIVCGSVSDSTEYNEKLKSIDRKVLAIETESGGMFGIALNHRIPAISIRGISDYGGAGINKNNLRRRQIITRGG